MSKNLTNKVETLDEPFILVYTSKTKPRYLTLEDGTKITGVTIIGRVHKLVSSKDGFIRDKKPFKLIFEWKLWDAFADEVLDIELKALEKVHGELSFLIGKAGYIKLYENRPVTPSEIDVVTTYVYESVRGKEGECVVDSPQELHVEQETN